MKRNLGLWSVLIVLLLVLAIPMAGCGEAADPDPDPEPDPDPVEDPVDEGPKQGGTIRIAVNPDPENLNPLILPTGNVAPIFETVFNGLVRANPDWEWEPDIARDWEVSSDGRTVTFYLRDDVVFHDGVPMTAYDYEFTLVSAAHPDYTGGQFGYVSSILGAAEYRDGEVDGVEGIEVLDDYTIVITTVEPDASIFNTVSRTIPVLPKHILGDVPPGQWQQHEFNRMPIGTGPFKIVSRETDTHITVEAFDDHHHGRPYVDRLIWRVGDDQAMLGAFMNQEVDIIRTPEDEVSTVEGLPFADVHVHERGSFQYIGLNNLQPALGEVTVRQAIATALNIPEITAVASAGFGTPIVVPHVPSSWVYPEDFAGWPYDPDRAAEMLDEAGWTVNPDTDIREKDGIEMSFMWHNADGSAANRTAALVQQQLEDINIEIEIQVVDFVTMTHLLMPRDADGTGRPHDPDDYHIYALGLTVGPDPQGMQRQFHSSMVSPFGHNYVGYKNDRVDELWDRVRSTLDLDQRRTYAQELYTILGEEVPWIPLYAVTNISVAHDKVQNFEPNILGQVWNVTEWWLDE